MGSITSPNTEVPTADESKRGARGMVELGLSRLPPLASHLEEFFVEIPVTSSDGSTWKSPTKVIRPKLDFKVEKPRPLIIYFFGGGFQVGDPDQVTSPAREWAEEFNATVVLPSYRLMPEVRFPVPMTDAMSAVKTIASGWTPDFQRQHYFGADPKDGFVLGGISSGASAASVVAGLTSFSNDQQYELQVSLTGVFLCTGWFFRSETIPDEHKSIWTAMEDNANNFGFFKSADMDNIYHSLQVTDPKSTLLTPAAFFQDGKRPTAGVWPPTYFQACQHDPLRDDSIVFERMLAKIGTKTKIHVFPHDAHAGMSVLGGMLGAHQSTNPTIEENTMSAMAWLLKQRE